VHRAALLCLRSQRTNSLSGRAQPRTPSEEIAGLVERVTFFNEESGFAVLRAKVRGQRDLITVLGSLPKVSAGEWLTAKGWWVRDKEHGLQFKAQVLKATPPTTSEGVERYLGGGFVKGVGPVPSDESFVCRDRSFEQFRAG
jgi:exodeoxyribonuclease V alpha subunit